VSRSLVDAFVERLKEFMIRPPHEIARVVARDPTLSRHLWRMCVIYAGLLRRAAEEAGIPPDLYDIAYATFGFACGLYELLEEAEEAEELERLAKRR